jgi:hypothetical protein
MNPKHFMFSVAGNYHRINSYNPLLTLAWLANADISPVTSTKSVLFYMGKYARKRRRSQVLITIY